VSKRTGEKRKMAMETELIRFKAKKLIKSQAFLEGEVSLASGKKSNYYVKLLRVLNNPFGLKYIVDLLLEEIRGVPSFNGVGGIALGGAPLVYGFLARWPAAYGFLVRTDEKTHGFKETVELPAYMDMVGKKVVLFDDVMTSGGSLLKGYELCKEHGLNVVTAIVVVDRQEGGIKNCAAEGLEVKSLFTVNEILKE
jgi:orotate phosphoribosyltransferase